MLFRKYFYAVVSCCLIVYGCNSIPSEQKNIVTAQRFMATPAAPQVPSYTITEDFETGKKSNYTAGEVQLITGKWEFKNALLGAKDDDKKNGLQSARIRAGSIAMNFDLSGVRQIKISHAKYGDDGKSKWQLYFSADSGTTYLPIGSIINETDTILKIDSFAFDIAKKVRFKIVKKGAARINIDDITFKGIGDAGIVIGIPEAQQPDTIKVPSGAKRGITIGNDAPPTTGDNSNMLFGNPSGAQPVMAMADNYLMDMGYYIESYNNTKAGPNWVSWHLDATNISGTAARLNNFAAFNGLPNNWFAVKNNSYSYNTYGFDRGHNCPSGDRSSSVNANSATFLMTNMIPQAPNNNQDTWGNFEDYLRSLVLQGNEVYIIMGSYGSGGVGARGYYSSITSGNYKINVPAYIWKVALIIPAGNNDISRVNKNTRIIAINTPNKNDINKDWKLYQVSVRSVELATGYDLLSNLPQHIQDALEAKKYPL